MGIWDRAKASVARATGRAKEYYVFAYDGGGREHWKQIDGPYLTRERADEEVKNLRAGGWTGNGIRLAIKHLTKSEMNEEFRKKVPSSWYSRKASASRRAR